MKATGFFPGAGPVKYGLMKIGQSLSQTGSDVNTIKGRLKLLLGN
jgi:hypothetical protein